MLNPMKLPAWRNMVIFEIWNGMSRSTKATGNLGVGRTTLRCAAIAAWFIRLAIVLGTGHCNAVLQLTVGALMQLGAERGLS